jgi:UPF0042 nucleotide-binding protein
MHLLIVTGLSGAGKTQAMKVLEDLDFFCIDNLPPPFLPQLSELHGLAAGQGKRVAVAMDVRGRDMFADLFSALDELRERGTPHQILFLDCADDILVRRYSETRRRHPLGEDSSIFEQIAQERALMAGVRDRANLIIDTSNMRALDLKARLAEIVTGQTLEEMMQVDLMSFGFKHGVPLDADVVLDVRFLPNPYYEQDLREATGLEDSVADFVLSAPEAEEWLHDTLTYLRRWLPASGRSGRRRLTVAIGCTGGQHRSVALTGQIAAKLAGHGFKVMTRHRDMKKNTREVISRRTG